MNIDDIKELAAFVISPTYVPPTIPEGFHWGKEISGTYYWFLYEAAKKWQLGRMIELGMSTGASALMLGLGNPNGRVLTIEIRPQPGIIESLQFVAPNVSVFIGDSVKVAANSSMSHPYCDLLFIDTEHSNEQVIAEYQAWLPYIKDGGLILVDDINWSAGAWELLPQPKIELEFLHPQVGFGALIK